MEAMRVEVQQRPGTFPRGLVQRTVCLPASSEMTFLTQESSVGECLKKKKPPKESEKIGEGRRHNGQLNR